MPLASHWYQTLCLQWYIHRPPPTYTKPISFCRAFGPSIGDCIPTFSLILSLALRCRQDLRKPCKPIFAESSYSQSTLYHLFVKMITEQLPTFTSANARVDNFASFLDYWELAWKRDANRGSKIALPRRKVEEHWT